MKGRWEQNDCSSVQLMVIPSCVLHNLCGMSGMELLCVHLAFLSHSHRGIGISRHIACCCSTLLVDVLFLLFSSSVLFEIPPIEAKAESLPCAGTQKTRPDDSTICWFWVSIVIVVCVTPPSPSRPAFNSCTGG